MFAVLKHFQTPFLGNAGCTMQKKMSYIRGGQPVGRRPNVLYEVPSLKEVITFLIQRKYKFLGYNYLSSHQEKSLLLSRNIAILHRASVTMAAPISVASSFFQAYNTRGVRKVLGLPQKACRQKAEIWNKVKQSIFILNSYFVYFSTWSPFREMHFLNEFLQQRVLLRTVLFYCPNHFTIIGVKMLSMQAVLS